MIEVDWTIPAARGVFYDYSFKNSVEHNVSHYYIEEKIIKKNGKPGKRYNTILIDFCIIYTCDKCGKIGTNRRVRERHDVYGWNKDVKNWRDKRESKHTLCTACWNRVKPIVRMKELADGNKKAINKLIKAIHDEKKQLTNQHNGATA